MLCAVLLALAAPSQEATPGQRVLAVVELPPVSPVTRFAPAGLACAQWAQVTTAAGLDGLVVPWFEGADQALPGLEAACAGAGLALEVVRTPVEAARGAPFELEAAVHAAHARGERGLVSLRVAPDGRVPEEEARRLALFRRWRERTFDHDLARDARVFASNAAGDRHAHAPTTVIDGDPDTWWATDDEVRRAFLDLELAAPAVVDRVVLEEPVGLHGRIRRFQLQGMRDNLWSELHQGRGVGPRLVLLVDPALYQAFRFIVQEAEQSPALSRFSLFATPPTVEIHADERVFLGSSRVRFSTSNPEAVVRYTLDGSLPDEASALYTRPLAIDQSCTLTALAFAGDDAGVSPARIDLRAYTAETLRAPEADAPARPGLTVRGAQVDLWTLDRLPGAGPWEEGEVTAIGPGPGFEGLPFALVFEGYVRAPADGIYAFFVESSDGGRLHIGDTLVVDNDGLHARTALMGEVGLRAGWHPLRVEYFHATGEALLEVAWRGPRLSKQLIDPSQLGRR